MEDLRLCMVRASLDSDRRFCFELQSPSRLHVLQADSEEECNAWVSALQQGIGSAIQGAPHAESHEESQGETVLRTHKPKYSIFYFFYLSLISLGYGSNYFVFRGMIGAVIAGTRILAGRVLI